MFEGHIIYKIGNDWIFDLTEFIGYRVYVNEGEVENFTKAFTVTKSADGDYLFEKIIEIPVGVMRKTTKIIENYIREAMING